MVDQGGAEKKEQMGRKRLSEEFCWEKNWAWEKEGREWRMKERQTEREKEKTEVLLAPEPFRRTSGKRDWEWAELT